MNPQVTTFNGEKVVEVRDGQVARMFPYYSGFSVSHASWEGLITVEGWLPDIEGAPQVEFYLGGCSGSTNLPLDATTTHFVGLYKSSTGWQYDATNKMYYIPTANPVQAVRRTGSSNTVLGSFNTDPVYLPTVAASANARLAVLSCYFLNTGSVTINHIASTAWNCNVDYPGDLLTASDMASGPWGAFKKQSLVSFSPLETSLGMFDHAYFGWRTVAGTEVPFYLRAFNIVSLPRP